jgi:hypothetical protein
MATARYGIYYFSRLKWDFSTLVGKGRLGGKLSDFYIFYCMVIELSSLFRGERNKYYRNNSIINSNDDNNNNNSTKI